MVNIHIFLLLLGYHISHDAALAEYSPIHRPGEEGKPEKRGAQQNRLRGKGNHNVKNHMYCGVEETIKVDL